MYLETELNAQFMQFNLFTLNMDDKNQNKFLKNSK